jgi:NADH-quinone oxidoreductase subunit A
MDTLLREYLPILIFLVIAVALTAVMLSASLLLGKQNPDSEKLSPYECGFEAFDDARRQFDVRFYLVSILFIIFDLEVAFLFPWAVTLGKIGIFGFWSMMIFLGVLTVGFIYEWKKGALEWESWGGRCRPAPIRTGYSPPSPTSSPTRALSSHRWTSW